MSRPRVIPTAWARAGINDSARATVMIRVRV